jgi:hypothetical protein
MDLTNMTYEDVILIITHVADEHNIRVAERESSTGIFSTLRTLLGVVWKKSFQSVFINCACAALGSMHFFGCPLNVFAIGFVAGYGIAVYCLTGKGFVVKPPADTVAVGKTLSSVVSHEMCDELQKALVHLVYCIENRNIMQQIDSNTTVIAPLKNKR